MLRQPCVYRFTQRKLFCESQGTLDIQAIHDRDISTWVVIDFGSSNQICFDYVTASYCESSREERQLPRIKWNWLPLSVIELINFSNFWNSLIRSRQRKLFCESQGTLYTCRKYLVVSIYIRKNETLTETIFRQIETEAMLNYVVKLNVKEIWSKDNILWNKIFPDTR